MTAATNDQAFKHSEDHRVQAEVGPSEPPPSYFAQTESQPTFKTKPTNFLVLSTENSNISGEFVIDPSIRIPSSMLPPLGIDETEDDRKNLSLTSRYNSVNPNIWLLPGTPLSTSENTHKHRRTTIALTSEYGSISAQLHTFDGAAPFSLTGRTSRGMVRLAIPHSFQGLISLSTRHGTISLGDSLVQNMTQLSQLGDTQRYFVGDFRALGEDAWEGDQVEIEAHYGSIRLKYVDQVSEAQGMKGLWSRLFGV